MLTLWNVLKVPYLTYAEVESLAQRVGPVRAHSMREIIARNLTFEAAQKMVQDLGFGHSMHPAGERDADAKHP